jgi:sugar phosphate isomerase/epimerase
MRLATTTLGCPAWDLPTILARVAGYGFDAIDFRGLQGEMKLWRRPEFTADLATSAARIRDSGLAVSCISTGVRLTETDPARIAEFDEELMRSAELCAALGCRQLRVFGGDLKCCNGSTEADRPRVIEQVVTRLGVLAGRVAAIAPVDLLVETHDAWTASAHLATVLAAVARPDVGCCWDIKHTWWMAQEVAQRTWKTLAPWVRNTHWKDARRTAPAALMADGKTADRVRGAGLLVPVGEGVAPLADACELLLGAAYDGWWTLEWEKHWHPHIAGPEAAFPGFIRQMRSWRERFASG